MRDSAQRVQLWAILPEYTFKANLDDGHSCLFSADFSKGVSTMQGLKW
jgi:hypothetical protein